MIKKEEFKKIFRSSFYNKIVTDSLVLKKNNYSKTQFNEDVEMAYNQLKNFNYSPNVPFERVFSHKNNYVARIINVFYPRDEISYYFLTKMIEDDIAENRVEGTYGGWRIDNKIRLNEQDELNEAEYFINSYNNPEATNNWKEFSKHIKYHFDTSNYTQAIMFDISNFYDSVNLNILERKLHFKIKEERKKYIPPLLYFLKYWNKRRENYNMTTVGIPQTEFGDQSRLLANFYLQDYDIVMKKNCNENDSKYLRFADDQIVLLKDNSNFNKIMLKANDELNKIGLNINAKKTVLLSKEEINFYYLYDELSLLGENKFDDAFNKFYNLYKIGVNIRSDTFLRRILNIGMCKFSEDNKNKIKKIVTNSNFIINNSFYYMKKVYHQIDDDEKKDYLNKLDELIDTVYFNEFHYNCLKLYEAFNLDDRKEKVIKKIEQLKEIY